MHRQIVRSHNLVAEIKEMLTGSKIGTPSTFCGDMSSIITNSAGGVQMTNEPLQYVHLNPIPVWYLVREVICRSKSLRI